MSLISPIGSSYNFYKYPLTPRTVQEEDDNSKIADNSFAENENKESDIAVSIGNVEQGYNIAEEDKREDFPRNISKKRKVGVEEALSEPKTLKGKELSEGEKEKVEKLEKRDREVKAHEQAHLTAAGPYAKGGAKFKYEVGPDGKRYAREGHVNIDASRESTPEKTVSKARVIKRAALAPRDPSVQDRKVAMRAARMEQEAKSEIAEEKQAEFKEMISAGDEKVKTAKAEDIENINGTSEEETTNNISLPGAATSDIWRNSENKSENMVRDIEGKVPEVKIDILQPSQKDSSADDIKIKPSKNLVEVEAKAPGSGVVERIKPYTGNQPERLTTLGGIIDVLS